MSYCTNLRFRKKKGKIYCYCVHKRSVIEQKECFGCLNKEYKKVAKMPVKKRIRPISKKRITVSEKTYNIVLDRSKDIYGVPHCQFCGSIDNLQLHHVYYRSERKDLIDNPDNCLMLCHKDFSKNKCHRLVHNNKKKYQHILLDILDEIKKAS